MASPPVDLRRRQSRISCADLSREAIQERATCWRRGAPRIRLAGPTEVCAQATLESALLGGHGLPSSSTSAPGGRECSPSARVKEGSRAPEGPDSLSSS